MQTSARRFVDGGIFRVLAHDCRIWGLDLLQRPTQHFGPAYQEDNLRRGLSAGFRVDQLPEPRPIPPVCKNDSRGAVERSSL